MNHYRVDITYKGKASHAAAFPWEGINALDAAVMTYQSVSVLRQQMKPSWRVHGVITNGGAKPNIIPEEASMSYYVRAPNKLELKVLQNKMRACFESAGSATRCQVYIFISLTQVEFEILKMSRNFAPLQLLVQLRCRTDMYLCTMACIFRWISTGNPGLT